MHIKTTYPLPLPTLRFGKHSAAPVKPLNNVPSVSHYLHTSIITLISRPPASTGAATHTHTPHHAISLLCRSRRHHTPSLYTHNIISNAVPSYPTCVTPLSYPYPICPPQLHYHNSDCHKLQSYIPRQAFTSNLSPPQLAICYTCKSTFTCSRSLVLYHIYQAPTNQLSKAHRFIVLSPQTHCSTPPHPRQPPEQ